MKTCKDCIYFLGCGDWNLCCKIKYDLCYEDTPACDDFKEIVLEESFSCTSKEDVAPVKYGKWISVKVRLPEEHENVLVAVKSPFFGILLNIDEMEYDEKEEEKTWLLHERGGYKITHWMPLPEPPKEAEE